MTVRRLKRTVLIGLGGTGKKALLYAKKQFLETLGEEPPLVKFLLIDTTSANTDFVQARTPDNRIEKVRLKASEVLHIEARGASLLPQVHDEVRTWFPHKADLKANILSGAGQIRALGRLALFANAATVHENLRDLLSIARDYLDERPTERGTIYKPYSSNLTVALVGSLAGGTGSGIFLDVAFVLRELMKDEDQLFGYFLLPDIYVNRPGTQNVEANAYAALKELDYFMSREDTWTYSFGGRRIRVQKKPFDMVFLVNRQNRAGKTFNDVEDLAELLGLGLYLTSGPLGKEQADVFDNIVHQLNEQKGRYYGKTAHYASFGAAELRFNPGNLDESKRRSRVITAIHELLSETAPWSAHEIARWGEQIRYLALPSGEDSVPINLKPSSSREEDKENWSNLRSKLEARPQEVAEALVNAWQEPDIWGYLREALQDHSLQDLINALEKVLKDYKNQGLKELQDQRQKIADELEDILNKNEVKINETPPRRLWGGSPPSEPVLNRRQIRSLWEHASKAGLAEGRVRVAERFLDLIEKVLEDLNTIKRRLEKERQRLLEAQGEHSGGRDYNPFTLTLPPPYLDLRPQEAGAMQKRSFRWDLDALRENTEGVVRELLGEETTSLRDWLNEAIRQRENDSDTWDAVERTFRELDELSAPAWDYQDAWVSNPGVGYKELVHIMGFEDASDREHPLVSNEELLSVFAGTLHDRMRLQRVSTGDPSRVLFYKVEASIPAFTLRGIDLYRERYLQLRGERSFHIHRDWENTLPDLLPSPSLEEVAEVWTKARLFGILKHDGSQYRFPDHRRGKGNYLTLGNRPGEAFRELAQNFFAFKDLEAQVKAEESKRKTSAEAVQTLLEGIARAKENRWQKLRDLGEAWEEEDRKVFQIELERLQAFEEKLAQYKPATDEDDFPTV